MTNDLKERLEALSAGATQGTWAWKETSKIDCGYVGEDDWPTVLHGAYHEGAVDECDADGLLCSTLVNAFRSGDLITLQELDEAGAKAHEMFNQRRDEIRDECLQAADRAVAAEREAIIAEIKDSRPDRPLQARVKCDEILAIIRARSEQKGGA